MERRFEKADILLLFLTLSGSTFWKITLKVPLPLFLFIMKMRLSLSGSDLTYQVKGESKKCLVSGERGSGGGRVKDLILTLLFFFIMKITKSDKNPCFCLPNGIMRLS